MKILHIYDHTEPLQSGYVFRSRSLRAALIRAGHECHILSMPRHYADGNKTIYTKNTEIIDNQVYFRSRSTIFSKLPILRELAEISSTALYIKKLIKTHQYDILHAHSPVLGLFAALLGRYLSRKKNIKIVYEIRAFWEDAAVDQGRLKENSLKYRLIRALEGWGCTKADHIYPICMPLKNDLIQRGLRASKLTVIPNVLTENAFKETSSDDIIKALRIKYSIKKSDYILGFIGSFYRYEGLEDLMPIMLKFKQDHIPIKLLLVGGGPIKSKLEAYTHQHNLEKHIIFTGRIPHDQVSVHYQLCSAMIYPRRSMRLTETVTPLKPLEAAAAKIPIILSNIGGHQELLKHHETGILIDNFMNPLQASCEILNILKDTKKLDFIKNQAFEYVKNAHNAHNIVKRYYRF